MSVSHSIKIATFSTFIALACAFGPGLVQAQTEDYAHWAQSRGFSLLTPTSFQAPVANYPLLVRLDSTAADVFAESKPGGADLRFRRIASQGDFKNLTDYQLKYQIAHWDSAAREAEIWVLMDTVKPTAGVDLQNFPHGLTMYWGKPDAPAKSDAAAVFDTANGFVGVWHMGGSSPTAPRPNAVPGGNAALPSGASVASGFPRRQGVIGLADTLRGGTGTSGTARAADDHFDLGSGYANFNGSATLSLWLKPATPQTTAWQVFMALGNGAPGDNLTLGRMGDSQNLFGEVYAGTTSAGRTELNGVARFEEWQHVTFAVQGTHRTLYHNGGTDSVAGISDGTIPNVTRTMAYLGRSLWTDPNPAIAIDEVRLQRVRRSADWVRLDYGTQKPGSDALQRYSSVPTPALVSPAADAENVTATSTLSWQYMSVNLYRVQVSTESSFQAPILDSLVANLSGITVGPLPDGVYYWRVRGLELLRGTGPWSETRKFTVKEPTGPVGKPALVYPTAFAENVGPNSPQFTWKQAEGASSYQLQVATHHEFATLLRDYSGITGLTYTGAVGLSINGEYYWRVRGRNVSGVGPWSDVRFFKTVVSRPPAPLLEYPPNNATGTPANPTFSWAPSARTVSYRLRVATDQFMVDRVKDDTTTAVSMTVGLAANTTYYWQVIPKNFAGTGNASETFRFTTGATSGILGRSGPSSMSASRVGGDAVVRFSLERAERVTLRWRDLRGRTSAPLREETLPAGSHSLRLTEIPGGVGFLEIGLGTSTRTVLLAP